MISSFFNSICEPSPLLSSDALQRKRRTKQNKVILIMHLVIVITLCIHVSLSPKPSLGQFLFVGSHALNLVIFGLFCRSFPFFYKAFYVLTTLVIGPLALSLDPDGIFGCWIGINIYPIFMMYYCESHLVGIFVLLSQLFYLSKIYKPFMTEVLFSSDPEFYVTRLTGITAYTTIFNVIVVYIIGFSLQKSYMQELDESEQKKIELERQKVFLLSFSSELRNIIHAVAGSIQLSLLEQISPIVKGHLENAEAGTNLLLSMINNILDTGNMHVGELEINPTVTTIQSALEKMWNVCLYLLKAKNLTGYLKITKDIPHLLKIDEYRLMQIMLNMMNNAVHNTQRGSVNISLHWIPNANSVREEQFKPYPFDDTDEGLFEKEQSFALLDKNTIFVGTDKRKWVFGEMNQNRQQNHGILKIIITDTGEGVDESNLSSLFQGESSNKPSGNSLSLYITKQICHKMGGEIRVFSKVGKGTSFIICLPAEPVLMEKDEKIMSIRNFDDLNRWFKFKVIIADDMSFNIKILTNYFNKLGIDSIMPANDGKEAYHKFLHYVSEGYQHQIICLDVDMPILNGKEVLKKIREYEAKHGLNPSLIIMVSGNCAESEIKECLSSETKPGADYFLKKPATFDELSNVLMKHFSIKFSSMFSDNDINS